MDKVWRWVKAAGVRAIKTMAQAALAMLGGEQLGLLEVQWLAVLSVAALAGIVSLLTSVAGLPELQTQQQGALGGEQRA